MQQPRKHILLDILSVTGPIYLTIALGYVATRLGLFKASDMRIFGTYVLYFALPALLFRALTKSPFQDVINPSYLVAYAVGSLLVLGSGYLVVRLVFGRPATTATFSAMGMSCPNSGFVGYPVMLLTFPAIAGTVLTLNFLVENLLLIPLILALGERAIGEKGDPAAALRQIARRLVANPIIIAIAAGLAFSLTGISLPEPITRTVDLFAASSAAVSLFVIGGTLVGLPVRGMNARVAPIVVGKLMLHPLAVAALVFALPYLGLPPIPSPLDTALILTAAMPILSIYPILAQKYGEDGMAAVALLATTLVSFFTISALLWLVKYAPA